MFWQLLRHRELRTIWRVRKGARASFLVGTAHFSPYSFKKSLRRLLKESESALFEGPLDASSMEQVVAAGRQEPNPNGSILDNLDSKAIEIIANILHLKVPGYASFHGLEPAPTPKTFVTQILSTMKPWMVFFNIYTAYLKKNGWKYSVDMEAYAIANELGLEIAFMEAIEDQIEVLESLSRQQMTDFLKRIGLWRTYTRDFVRWYLDGDITTIASNPYGFPTRNPMVIDRRDAIFCEKMQPYLEHGRAAVFVGIPHVPGISQILARAGYTVEQEVAHVGRSR